MVEFLAFDLNSLDVLVSSIQLGQVLLSCAFGEQRWKRIQSNTHVEVGRRVGHAMVLERHEIEAMETYAKVIDVFFELLWARVPITTCDDSIGDVGLNEVLQNNGARGRCGADAFD